MLQLVSEAPDGFTPTRLALVFLRRHGADRIPSLHAVHHPGSHSRCRLPSRASTPSALALAVEAALHQQGDEAGVVADIPGGRRTALRETKRQWR